MIERIVVAAGLGGPGFGLGRVVRLAFRGQQREPDPRFARAETQHSAAALVEDHEVDLVPFHAEHAQSVANRFLDRAARTLGGLHARFAPFLPGAIAGRRPPPPGVLGVPGPFDFPPPDPSSPCAAAPDACDLGGALTIGWGLPTTR